MGFQSEALERVQDDGRALQRVRPVNLRSQSTTDRLHTGLCRVLLLAILKGHDHHELAGSQMLWHGLQLCSGTVQLKRHDTPVNPEQHCVLERVQECTLREKEALQQDCSHNGHGWWVVLSGQLAHQTCNFNLKHMKK